jgi:hypothetical protein
MHTHRLTVLVTTALLIAAALLSAQTSTNTPATSINNSMVVIPGTAPKIVQKAISLGPAPPHKEITVMILPKLKMNELNKYIQELYTPPEAPTTASS